MQHISEILTELSSRPLTENRKEQIRKRLETLERNPLHPMLALVLKDMRDLLTELDRLRGGE